MTQIVAPRIVAPRIVALRIVVIRSAVIRSAVIRAVALIVVPISVLIAVLIGAVIQALNLDRDALNAGSHEELRGELHEEFHHDLAVAEAQDVLQRHLVEFLCWSQEQEVLSAQ